MNDIQKEKIEKLVITFAKEANITNPNKQYQQLDTTTTHHIK